MSATNRATAFEVDVGSIMPLQGMSGQGGLLNTSPTAPDSKPNMTTPATTINPWAPK